MQKHTYKTLFLTFTNYVDEGKQNLKSTSFPRKWGKPLPMCHIICPFFLTLHLVGCPPGVGGCGRQHPGSVGGDSQNRKEFQVLVHPIQAGVAMQTPAIWRTWSSHAFGYLNTLPPLMPMCLIVTLTKLSFWYNTKASAGILPASEPTLPSFGSWEPVLSNSSFLKIILSQCPPQAPILFFFPR